MNLSKAIQGILFYKAEPVKKKFLAEFCQVEADAVDEAIAELRETLSITSMKVTETDDEVQLVLDGELDELIERLRTDEQKRDIGRAGAETLSIILYRGPITRADIDRIRGVNSAFILRNLMIRGLIEREVNKNDKRTYTYRPTISLFNHLGIEKREELPEFEETMDALDRFEKHEEEKQAEQNIFNA